MKRYMFALLFCLTTCLLASPAYAARLIRIKIYLDGEVILEGGAGDDGHPDADAVWKRLRSRKLKATEHFQKLNVAPDAKETTVTSDEPIGPLDPIIVDINYGGKATTRRLKLIRVPMDKHGREWTLDAAQVDELFHDRYIHRSEAARLENPRNY